MEAFCPWFVSTAGEIGIAHCEQTRPMRQYTWPSTCMMVVLYEQVLRNVSIVDIEDDDD